MNTDQITPTPTPRTDALWLAWAEERLPNGQFRYGPHDLIALARELERELAEALSDLEFRRGLYALQSERLERLERELSAERALADSLADALAVYKGDVEHVGHWMPAPAQNKAGEALAAWKEARGA